MAAGAGSMQWILLISHYLSSPVYLLKNFVKDVSSIPGRWHNSATTRFMYPLARTDPVMTSNKKRHHTTRVWAPW